MEELKNGEQLEECSENVQNGNVEENLEKGTSFSENSDSSLGKFKDAQSLLDAYNNLQAEFTRKCQKLSEVSKELEEKSLSEKLIEKEDIPVFQKETWQDDVSSFLSQNLEAKKYSGDIANEILNDKSLQNSPNALELAWARVMKKNFVEPEQLANDQNFINEKILSQDQIKKQVLDEYFKNLRNENLPTIMSGKGNVGSFPISKPTNLKQAKQIVEKMLNVH